MKLQLLFPSHQTVSAVREQDVKRSTMVRFQAESSDTTQPVSPHQVDSSRRSDATVPPLMDAKLLQRTTSNGLTPVQPSNRRASMAASMLLKQLQACLPPNVYLLLGSAFAAGFLILQVLGKLEADCAVSFSQCMLFCVESVAELLT